VKIKKISESDDYIGDDWEWERPNYQFDDDKGKEYFLIEMWVGDVYNCAGSI